MSTLTDYFDRAYVINLPERKDRLRASPQHGEVPPTISMKPAGYSSHHRTYKPSLTVSPRVCRD
jgi:hypothetical protein